MLMKTNVTLPISGSKPELTTHNCKNIHLRRSNPLQRISQCGSHKRTNQWTTLKLKNVSISRLQTQNSQPTDQDYPLIELEASLATRALWNWTALIWCCDILVGV